MKHTEYEGAYKEEIQKQAEDLKSENMPEITKELYEEYFITGNRLKFERVYFKRRQFLTVYALNVCVVERQQDTDILLDVIEKILQEPTWVLPAHGSVAHFNGERNSIDLFAAETAGSLAEIFYLLKAKIEMNASVIQKWEELLEQFVKKWEKQVLSCFLRKDPCEWWEYGDMNWTSVCSGNLAIAAYALMQLGKMEIQKTVKIFQRVEKSMESYLKSMGEEGICLEGVSYYQYGMEYFLAFHELAGKLQEIRPDMYVRKEYSLGKAALFLQNMYLLKGKYINFSDCVMENKTQMGIVAYLSNYCENVRIPKEFCLEGQLKFTNEMERLGGEECHRFASAYRDYQWVADYGDCLKEETDFSNRSFIYEAQMWYIRRLSEQAVFYSKGGNNAEPHNHNDVGSFGLFAYGEAFLCELGAGEYTKGYFGEERYENLCTRSMGHNVVMVNGMEQKPGAEYKAEHFVVKEDGISLEIGKAYGIEADAVRRNICFFKHNKTEKQKDLIFSLTDEGKNVMITEVFLSWIKPQIFAEKGKKSVVLRGKEAEVWIQFPQKIRIKIEKRNYQGHDGSTKEVYQIFAEKILEKETENFKIKNKIKKMIVNFYLKADK